MAKEFRHQQQPACKPTNGQIHALILPTKNKNVKMSNIHHSHPINQQKKNGEWAAIPGQDGRQGGRSWRPKGDRSAKPF